MVGKKLNPWTVASQAPLSIGFSRQENWNGLPCSSPRDLPDPGNPHLLNLLHWQADSSPLSHLSSVAQLCPTLCDPMNCSTPGLSVHHQLAEFTQTHVHRVGDAIQPSHPLSSPSPPAPNPSQHQGLWEALNPMREHLPKQSVQYYHSRKTQGRPDFAAQLWRQLQGSLPQSAHQKATKLWLDDI